VNELIRSTIRAASTLCHEFAHAITFLKVQTLVQLEPKFNNEPFAEVGYAFENFLWGGTLNDSRSDGIWLHRWPPAGMLSAYNCNGVFRTGIYTPEAMPMPGGQWVDPKCTDAFSTITSGTPRELSGASVAASLSRRHGCDPTTKYLRPR
jgi:hypothetical protein